MLVFLLGYMGSGKTTLGQEIAQHLDYHFMDMDDLLEKAIGMPIKEFFEIHGEKVFRFAEHELLKEIMDEEDTVIATGGGTPCYYDNIELMNKAGLTIYLDVSSKELFDRLKGGSHQRPILDGIKEGGLQEFITEHLQQRSKYYLKAKLVINPQQTSLFDIVLKIKSFIPD